MNIIDHAISHSRLVIGILFFVLIAGTFSYISIPKEATPDVNIPFIYISLSQKGISPDDSERLLVKPIEDEVNNVEGVKEVRSTSYSGGGNVLLEFNPGFDADKAIDDVREKVDRAKGDLPSEADEPTVNEVNISAFPILLISLSGDLPDRTLQDIAEYLQEEIETIPSILEAKIGGKRKEQVDVIVDVRAIEGYGINLNSLISIVNQNNMMVSAGEQDTGDGSFSIKVPGLYENIDDVLDTPIKTFGDSVITFRDIAKVKRTFEDRKSYAKVNGKNSVTIEVSKRVGENIIQTVDQVREIVNEASRTFPPNVNVSFSQDSSKYIKTMLGDLQNNVIAAIILVLIIILGALGIRSGFLVGVSIPGAFLSGVMALSLMGFTVNIVVLFALILSVGLLVDGAIVVVEYADRKINEGLSISKSYALASKKMSLPIIASTATTLAAFLPLIFWPGLAGEFMKYLPITLICVLTSSLFMALIFVPVVGSSAASLIKILLQIILPLAVSLITFNLIKIGISFINLYGPYRIILTIINYIIPLVIFIFVSIKIIPFVNKISESVNKPVKKLSQTALALSAESKISPIDLPGITGFYAKLINKLLNHPLKVIIGAIIILISVQFTYARVGNGVEFFPEVEPDLSKIVIYARGNLSVEEKKNYVSRVEDIILNVQNNKNEFKNIYSISGNISDQSEDSEDFIGSISLEYKDLDKRRPSKIILKEIISKAKSINGIKIETREQESGPPRGKPINVKLTSQDKNLLFSEASRLKEFMDNFPGLVNVESNLPAPGIEWEIKVNRKQAFKFGANISSIGNVIKLSTNGIKLGEYRPDDTSESIPIYLRYPQEGRTLDMLQNLRVTTNNGLVPISNFVEIVPKNRTGNIIRVDSKNAINIKTDVDIGIFADSKMKELEYALGISKIKPRFRGQPIDIKKFELNKNVRASLTGESEDQKEAQKFLSKAFGVALFMMLMILLLQFNSFYSSFLILFAVIMSTAGVLIGLIITGQAFGIVMTGVGVIALAGIVVNNNIILIDTFDYLKKEMPSIKEAIIKTGAQRLRPVLLTTFTTVLGLLPMVTMTNVDFITRQIKFGSQDGQWWVQLSTAIVFGLIFATILTLVVTPSLLMLRENFRNWYNKKTT